MHVCTLALCLEREFHVFRLPFFITLSRKGQATDLIRRSPRFLQIARFRYKYLRSKGVKEENAERTNVGPSFSSCFLLGAFSVYVFFTDDSKNTDSICKSRNRRLSAVDNSRMTWQNYCYTLALTRDFVEGFPPKRVPSEDRKNVNITLLVFIN